jgi:hypothetical protein
MLSNFINNILLRSKLSYFIIVVFSVSIISCGGGNSGSKSTESAPTQTLYYGSIYVNTLTGRAAISTDYLSQAVADSAASNSCYTRTDGSQCVRVLTFGTGWCGAVARAATFQFGFTFTAESASVVETARVNAYVACINAGGGSCEIIASACNSNGK